MMTAGVDLAAEAKKTGLAQIRWGDDRAVVEDVRVGGSDDDITELIEAADKTGIDCPLGWPRNFVKFVRAHDKTHVPDQNPADAARWRLDLCYRLTDLRVSEEVGVRGLSVATDRIGVTTLRCAALLSRLAAAGREVDRTGAGAVVEVYPAASLKRWGLPFRGYKAGKGREVRSALLSELLDQASWLSLGDYRDLCLKSDDAFDAVICALSARAAACHLVEPAPESKKELKAAAREGWIALPQGRVGDLLRAEPSHV